MLLVSVYVKFDEWGRMGNRMFQYAFGYILAKEKNVDLFTPEMPNFNIKSTARTLPTTNFINTRSYGNNFVDWNDLISTDKDIIVDSFVQKHCYYSSHKNILYPLFSAAPLTTINQNKLVVHIRETDYLQIGCFLGYDYYKQLIEESGFKDVIIVTDNSNCETVQKLISDGCTLNTEGRVNKFDTTSDRRAMIDFYTLWYSENIAISQSTFSWWAAFLGDHKKIIFPKAENVMWKSNPGRDDVNLIF